MTNLNARKGNDWLFPILCLFTVTFFVYRDFEIRMLYGFALLGLALGVDGLAKLRRNDPPIQDPIRLALLILGGAVFVNFLRPDSRHDAESASFIISMLICCAFVLISRPTERTSKLAMVICFAGAVGITAFSQFFEYNPWWFWNWFLMKLSPTAGNYLCYYVPKGYGFTLGGCTFSDYILFLGITVCCAYVFCGRKFDWKSALALVFAGVFLETILIIGRRGELLGAVACMALLVLALCGKKQRRILIVGGIIACAAAIAIIIPLLPWLRQFQPLIRYVMTFEQILAGQDITSGRTELYALAWNAFRENPLFGIGWDQFHTLIPQSFHEIHAMGTVEDVHCIYLQFLTEAGIVGTPFLIAPLVYLYYLVCSQFSRLKKRPGELRTARMLCISSFMIQSFLLFLGVFDPNFQRVIFWCFYAMALLMQIAALELEGAALTDPVSKLLNKLIALCAPFCRKVWELVTRKPKEGRFMAKPSGRNIPLTVILAVFTVTFFFYRDFGSRMIYGYALIGFLLAVAVLRCLFRDEKPVFTPVCAAAMALAAVILVHFLLPGARRDVDTTSYQISMLICIAYVAMAPAQRRDAKLAGHVMHAGALAMAAFVLFFTMFPLLFLQHVYPLLSTTARRYYDFFVPLGYGVSLGTYSYTDYVLFLGIAVCCGDLAVKPRTRKRILLNSLSLAALFLAMVVLGRRGELLAMAVAVLVLVLALCSRRKRQIILTGGSILAALGVTAFIALLPQLRQVAVLARYVETVEQLLSGGDITSGRGALMAVAVAGFLAHPIFGVGWGQYVSLSAQIGMCDTDGNLIEDCHNIYLQFLTETGVAGAVLILIPIVYLLVLTCRMLRAAKYMEDKDPLRFASISFLIQFFLLFLGIYDPSFQKIVFWCFYALALLFLKAALRTSGWSPNDPVSRSLQKLAPLGDKLWTLLRRPLNGGNA